MSMIWSGFSGRGKNQVNTDGTRNVHCYSCKQFICRSITITRALCAQCDKVQNEHKLFTPQQMQEYQLSKAMAGGSYDVSMLHIPEQTDPEANKFNFRSMIGEFTRAVGLAKPPKDEVKSAVLAKSKRRPRILENIDLGSLEDVEQNLKGKQG